MNPNTPRQPQTITIESKVDAECFIESIDTLQPGKRRAGDSDNGM
ncbi:hypothetical protein [Burkholderia paludis]|nr:hypothetical protein [Burkholderia paludis]